MKHLAQIQAEFLKHSKFITEAELLQAAQEIKVMAPTQVAEFLKDGPKTDEESCGCDHTKHADEKSYAEQIAQGVCGSECDHNASLGEKEAKPKNPWAICTKSVGRDSDKYEKCVKKVKKQM